MWASRRHQFFDHRQHVNRDWMKRDPNNLSWRASPWGVNSSMQQTKEIGERITQWGYWKQLQQWFLCIYNTVIFWCHATWWCLNLRVCPCRSSLHDLCGLDQGKMERKLLKGWQNQYWSDCVKTILTCVVVISQKNITSDCTLFKRL